MKETYSLILTHNECCYLSDVFSGMSHAPIESDEFQRLWLKIMGALLEMIDEKHDQAPIELNKGELWTVLTASDSTARVGTEQVGYALLVKAARGVRELEADEEVHGAVMRFGETDVIEMPPTDLKTRVQQAIAEVEHAHAHRRARKGKARRRADHKAG